jgi:pimeloyl-ACP methyl ester carboxylesterase
VPARLHHEQIVHTGRTPAHWLVITHGIFGAGSNWRGIARKVHERRPEWGIVLVDLRQHGRSEPGAPPHDLAAAAADLRALIDELALPIDAIAGHSFGGKVVLATRALHPIAQTWVLDASPSARPAAVRDPDNTVVRVLELMERLPRRWARRDDFVAAIVAEGQSLALAQWLAMNVVPDESGAHALRLDLGALRSLLADYYARDLWSSLLDPALGDVELVVATRSAAARDVERPLPPHVHVHRIEAGHWLHIDAPAAVVELFAANLRARPDPTRRP